MTVLEMFSLEGRCAVVTGASSGLGAAFARALAEAGCDVVLGARRLEQFEATAAEVAALGARTAFHPTDVTDPQACKDLAAVAVANFGKIDLLVNNAGIGHAAPATTDRPEDFLRVLETNLASCYWMAQASVAAMPPGSSIVNVSSVHGMTRSDLPTAAYAASKAGLLGLTRDLSNQWALRKGIRVKCPCSRLLRHAADGQRRRLGRQLQPGTRPAPDGTPPAG